jgi:hypothetical protein
MSIAMRGGPSSTMSRTQDSAARPRYQVP